MTKNYANIPAKIKQSTSVHDVIMSSRDMQRNFGKSMYFAIREKSFDDIDMIGANNMRDVIFYSAYFNIFGDDIDEGTLLILRATVEDPESLPYDIPASEQVFVMMDEFVLRSFDTVEKATEFIESNFKRWPSCKIEDFIVLIGRKMGENFHKLFSVKVHSKKDQLKAEESRREKEFAAGFHSIC